MGRPRKPANDQLTHQHNVRLTQDELACLHELAQQTGLTASDVLRHLLRSGSVEVARSDAFPPVLVFELNKIGVNLNQIAHKLNATGQPVPAELERTLARVNGFLEAAVRAHL